MIDSIIQQLMQEQHIPGLAIGINQADTVLVEQYHGYANLEHNVPVTSNTLFEIASVTKLFTAQAILLLVQDGAIALDDYIKQYVDSLPSAWERVTIQHCLAHQSGIPNYTTVDQYWQITPNNKTHAEMLSLVRELPLRFDPGARHAYDNTGFYLLGLVIEQVSGIEYEKFLAHRIFTPLHMTNTQANNYAAIIAHRAQGYTYQDDRLTNKAFYSTSNTFSAGILLSTLQDLMTWHVALFDDRLLNRYLRQLWWTPHPSVAENERTNNYTMGLGWFIVDSPFGQFLGHNGGIVGFAASLLYFPHTDVSAFVLCNAGHVAEPHQIAFKVITELGIQDPPGHPL